MLESLKQDSTYMQQRAARQAEARERWVEGLSFQPASIKQPDRPPLSAADQAKETVEKVRADTHTDAGPLQGLCEGRLSLWASISSKNFESGKIRLWGSSYRCDLAHALTLLISCVTAGKTLCRLSSISLLCSRVFSGSWLASLCFPLQSHLLSLNASFLSLSSPCRLSCGFKPDCDEIQLLFADVMSRKSTVHEQMTAQ